MTYAFCVASLYREIQTCFRVMFECVSYYSAIRVSMQWRFHHALCCRKVLGKSVGEKCCGSVEEVCDQEVL